MFIKGKNKNINNQPSTIHLRVEKKPTIKDSRRRRRKTKKQQSTFQRSMRLHGISRRRLKKEKKKNNLRQR